MDVSNRIRKLVAVLRAWMFIGIGIKRWLVILAIACVFIGMGIVYGLIVLESMKLLPEWVRLLVTFDFLPTPALRIGTFLLIGLALILWSALRLGDTLTAPFRRPDEPVIDALRDYQQQGRGPNIVVIGGGTGMPALLRGLTSYTRNITAIVTVADDGGSSGRLRRELGMLPPGDFRNNIAALSRDEALITQLMQYRFGDSLDSVEPSQLRGHAFGNLLIAALTGITGSFDEALLAMDRVLALRGRVMPSTLQDVQLSADMLLPTGERQRVVGESDISKRGGKIEHLYLEPNHVRAYPPALKAILQADLVVMGPGSLFTSVLPNLLVRELAMAIGRTSAKTLYVCNVATQAGETDHFTAADHVQAIFHNAPDVRVDYLLANNRLDLDSKTGGGDTHFVQPINHERTKLIVGDFVDEKRPWRHDSDKVAKGVIRLLNRG